MLTLIAAASLSLQLEAGGVFMANPTDDQYVLYHGNGLSYGVQMDSPAFGVSLREDVGRVVVNAGWRDLGHQYIETDIIPDTEYFKCRYKGNCPPKIERWTTRMSLSELYAQLGYKFNVAGLSVVPSVGMADERLPTSIQVVYEPSYWPGHPDVWHTGDERQSHPFAGVDVEHANVGLGVYVLQTNKLPYYMGDPGQGRHAIYVRLTYALRVH